jgi:hypothetical protein
MLKEYKNFQAQSLQGCMLLLLTTDQEGAPAPSSRFAFRAPLDSPGMTAPFASHTPQKDQKVSALEMGIERYRQCRKHRNRRNGVDWQDETSPCFRLMLLRGRRLTDTKVSLVDFFGVSPSHAKLCEGCEDGAVKNACDSSVFQGLRRRAVGAAEGETVSER